MKETRRMPLRQTIGISLALLVISAGAIAKTPDKSVSPQQQARGAEPRKAELCAGKARTASARTARHRSHSRSARHDASARPPYAAARTGAADPYWGAMHPTGAREIGKAAWYGLVGGRTSNGEILDTVSATAAHRTLPLASYARVTNLDSGRSVVVRINDRGPQNRRFVIDLSPRAADELDMKRAGVVNVIVEPVVAGPVPVRAEAVALYSTSGVTQ
jgi:rare lipoprotein A